MTQSVSIERHQFQECDVQKVDGKDEFVGLLTYKGFNNGTLYGDSLVAVRRQFQAICTLIERDGAMLRRGTIMTGYHDDTCKGDVLLPDGEIIGTWHMDAEDCCYFTQHGQDGFEHCAPSPWMLQDGIATWLGRQTDD